MKLWQFMGAHKELASKLAELEQRVDKHDDTIGQLIDAIRQLMAPPLETKKRRKIGFARDNEV